MGTAKIIAPRVTSSVPRIRGSAPYSPEEGFQDSPKKKSQRLMFAIAVPLFTSVKMMISEMISTVNDETAIRTYFISMSLSFFERLRPY